MILFGEEEDSVEDELWLVEGKDMLGSKLGPKERSGACCVGSVFFVERSKEGKSPKECSV